jgi:hypothetical protein
MPGVRDHDAIVIEDFNGLWDRGDDESAPSDHFIQADNVQYFNSGFETRDPLDKYQTIGSPLTKVLRIYDYVMQNGQSLLCLTEGGKIYHVIGATIMHGPILTIPEMTDFGFVAISGRAFITPFKTYVNSQGVNYQLGIQNEFLYVYKGDGTPARKAAGPPPVGGPLTAANGGSGRTDIGIHLIAVVYETDTGYLTALGPEVFAQFEFDGEHKILVNNIPVSPDSYVKKRHLVSTKQIILSFDENGDEIPFNGDQDGYQLIFIPDGNIDNNTDTSKEVEYYDVDLLDDASHLIDNFSEIPSGVCLNTYHSRLCIGGEFGNAETLIDLPEGIADNRSLVRVSFAGEPEAISKIDGIIITPLDGNAVTNIQEFRDILYVFKKSRTIGYSDNSDEPATWTEEIIDQGVGAPVHGIAAVLDSGGVNVDFLLIADWSGLMIFNGNYARPEMSWKIEDFWMSMDRNNFHYIQIVNDSLSKKIWITLPPPNQHIMLHADYGNGLDAKNIRWAKWLFDVKLAAITLIETNKLIMGAVDHI